MRWHVEARVDIPGSGACETKEALNKSELPRAMDGASLNHAGEYAVCPKPVAIESTIAVRQARCIDARLEQHESGTWHKGFYTNRHLGNRPAVIRLWARPLFRFINAIYDFYVII